MKFRSEKLRINEFLYEPIITCILVVKEVY